MECFSQIKPLLVKLQHLAEYINFIAKLKQLFLVMSHHPILIFSSLGFGSVAVHAYHSNSSSYAILYSIVTVLSLIYHSSGNLKLVDKLAAHVAFLVTVADIHANSWPKYASTIKYLAFICILWVSQGRFPQYSTFLHFSLHLCSIVGMHFHLDIE
jgi:hypothetical protein